MKRKISRGEDIYNRILNAETTASLLNSDETALLFGYLCHRIEQGMEVDGDLLNCCADRLNSPEICDCESIISKTYERLCGEKKHKIFMRNILRRCIVAAAAICTFAVSSLITSSALGVDNVVHQINTIWEENNKYVIQFEDLDNLKDNATLKKRTYKSIDRLFSNELEEYIYPSDLPDDIVPVSVTDYGEGNTLFALRLKKEGCDELWQITAKKGDNTYMPMGYQYTANCGNTQLDFVYTLSRNGKEITEYTLYTLYDGTLYTFRLYTSDWEEATAIINSLKLPE